MNKLFTILFLSCFSLAIHAQSAKAILDKASQAYDKAGGITATFSLVSEDTVNKTQYSQSGAGAMLGNRFKIDVTEGTTWFDGTTQWVYIKDTQEVNISTPSGLELQSISPIAMFNIYKKGFDLTLVGDKTVDGKRVSVITMTPQSKVRANNDITHIEVHVDKTTNIFSKLITSDKSGFKNTITIKNLKTGQNLPVSTFQFKQPDYPNAEIIDLR